MSKFVIVTGGVISNLGKGITAAGLGRLLKNRGVRVTMQKFNPYLNVDPGTMSPYQHGEVFVTDDGAETDLDIGHYERFLDMNLTRVSDISGGKLFSSVINKERLGKYVGSTVGVVPHVTTEVKESIMSLASADFDIVIVEIGGTMNDMETSIYLQGVRQLISEVGSENVFVLHVDLLPYIEVTGETKIETVVHSSDEIREELSGDVNNQNMNAKIFELLHKRVKRDLMSDFDVIYDATNISSKRRRAFVNELKKISCHKRVVIIATPYEVCLEQNEHRDRVVPEAVLERMYRNFEIPFWHEGWDDIQIFYPYEEFQWCYETAEDFIYQTIDFEQNNSHHQETLGKHCLDVHAYIRDTLDKRTCHTPNANELTVAALIPDCAKPFTKTFANKKGTISKEAHYSDHEKVGCYNSLFYNIDKDIDKLYVAALIQYHMIMHFMKNWKPSTVKKYENIFQPLSDNFWDNLKLLNEADSASRYDTLESSVNSQKEFLDELLMEQREQS